MDIMGSVNRDREMSQGTEQIVAGKDAGAAKLLKSLSRTVVRATTVAAGLGVVRGFAAIELAWMASGVIDAAAFPDPRKLPVGIFLAALAAIAALRALLLLFSARAAGWASTSARRALFGILLRKIETLGPSRLSDLATGDLVTKLTDGVAALDPYWRRWTPAAALAVSQPVAALVVITPLDWRSAAILSGSLPLLALGMVIAGKGAKNASDRQWETLTRLGGGLLDSIQGLPDILLANAGRREAASVRRVAEAYRRETMVVLRLVFLSSLTLEFFATIAIAALALAIGFRLMWGEMDFRNGLFILLAAPEVFAPIRAFGAERHARMEAVAAAEGLAELLGRPTPRIGTSRVAGAAPPTLRFKSVNFAYPDGTIVIRNLDLEIRPRERIAVVGPSGAGKSTLLGLLAGFLEPTSGAIYVDGVLMSDLDQDDWRRRIAFLPQRPHVFDADVDENVALGRNDGDVSDALVAAGIKDIVDALPEGRRTRLAEQGRGLSGGEIQRLALARAFYGGGTLVLVDEPTAHLDAETERTITERVSVFAESRTLIVVAHRKESLTSVQRVIEMKDGRIVEDGAPSELMTEFGPRSRFLPPPPLDGTVQASVD